METIESADRSAHPDLLDRIRGKTVAVDLSIWIFEAISQQATNELFTPQGCVAKLVFERACNYLRHGVTLVGVLDGVPPPEKLARLGLQTTQGAGGGGFRALGECAKKVLNLLGLAVLTAPGEAEATCAALDVLNLVNGCATSDGDAFLFGATTVFKTLKLYADAPELSKIERCESGWIAQFLLTDTETTDTGTPNGTASQSRQTQQKPELVANALVALATLTGGDYAEGATNVGGTYAARVIRRLAAEAEAEMRHGSISSGGAAEGGGAEESRGVSRGGGGAGPSCCNNRETTINLTGTSHDTDNATDDKSSMKTMCARLDAFLNAPCDPTLASLTKCTGCATCKHEGGLAQKKKKCTKGCVQCGVPSGTPCVFREGECECAFHRRTPERWANAARRRAKETAGFTDASRRAAAAYASQSKIALDFVKGLGLGGDAAATFRWSARPDVQGLSIVMHKLCELPFRRTREKLLPLLLEWDVCHAGFELHEPPHKKGDYEFAVVGVTKLAGAKGMSPWRYLLEVDALDAGERAAFISARDEIKTKKKETKSRAIDAEASQVSQISAPDDDDMNLSQTTRDLLFFAGKPNIRSVRVGLVNQYLPELVARFNQPKDVTKTPTPRKEPITDRVSAPTPRATPRGVPKEQPKDQRSILGFVSRRKDPGTVVSNAHPPFATPQAPRAGSPGVGAGTAASPVLCNTGSSSDLEASGIPPARTARRRILDDTHFEVRLSDGAPVAVLGKEAIPLPVASPRVPVTAPRSAFQSSRSPAVSTGSAFHSIGVGLVDLTTPSPGGKRPADPPVAAKATQLSSPLSSPLTSPTKRAARQAGIQAFMTPAKKPPFAFEPAGATKGVAPEVVDLGATKGVAPEVVDLADSDDSP